MQLKDVGRSLRRHWLVALVIMLATPLVAGYYLYDNRNPTAPPARYTTSADVLIPTKDEKGERPANVPPVLLQGQTDLALSARIRSIALEGANLDPNDESLDVSFAAKLNETGDIMTLSVSASRPELASSVLDQYATAFKDGRRQSVLDAAVEQADAQRGTVNVLIRKLTDVEGQLVALGVPLPAQVPEGPLTLPEGTPNSTVLLLYQRNSILNEIQARQADFGKQTVLATIPADFSDIVQRRTASRVAPPPPSHTVPALEILGVGLLLALGVPVLMDRFDRSITDSRAAASSLRSRVLVTVPAVPRRVHQGYAPQGSTWDGAFRSLAATSITTDELPKALMVTSPTGSIQDTVAANFARSLARLGVKVALIGTVPRQRWYARTVPAELLPGQEEEYDYDEADLDEAGRATVATAATTAQETASAVATEARQRTREMPGSNGHAEEEFDHPNFVDLLLDAQAGRLPADFRDTLATVDEVPNLYVIPPGRAADVPLDGLPSLLDAFARDGIDTVVIGGPAYLEDPNATIIAWSARNVLWAIEMGHVDSRDAQLAADRLDIAGVAPFGIAVVNRHL
ncbi:MAG TPA: hypothetical protein VHI95_03580 [Acidimicrobiales bacterium]|nr:hypothetical protein [Acidimicrobiales bacterium]